MNSKTTPNRLVIEPELIHQGVGEEKMMNSNIISAKSTALVR